MDDQFSPATDIPAALDHLAAILAAHRFRYAGEKDLQAGIAAALAAAGVPHRREWRLGPRDVVDFLVLIGHRFGDPIPGDGDPAWGDRPAIGLEVKVDGGAAPVAAQLLRYAASPRLSGLALATTRSRHLIYPAGAPLGGKPFRAHLIRGGF